MLTCPAKFLDKRPIVIVLAGSNNAGQLTFYESFVADSRLRFVNAEMLAVALGVSAYEAAGLASSLRSEQSIQRVTMRLSQGGHDVPDEKLCARFSRTKANLKRAIERLPYVIVYSNSDLTHPYKLVDLYENGKRISKL